MSILAQNMQILHSRYPALAEHIDAFSDKDKVIIFQAKDGGIAYGLRTTSGIQPITDPVNPLTRIGNQLTQNSAQLNNFSNPIMLVGLYPGDELLYLHDLAEKTPSQATQHIYVAIDSIACFYAFLQNMDANRVLNSPRVRFFMADQAPALADEFRANPDQSYLFTLISGSRNGTVNKVMTPFVSLVSERNAEFKRMLAENQHYYDSIDDETLASIICSKAGRPPRLMTITSSHSTVTQYSCRDLCTVMEKSGWHTEQLLVSENPTPHYLVSRIHQFKPDVFLFVNHLRSEAPSVYPANMMFITWVQDTVPHINRHETAEAWNAIACGNREDHRPQTIDNRPKSESCTSPAPQGDPSSPLFTLRSAQRVVGPSASPSPLSSHNSTTQQPNNPATIKSRRRDLIIGYTGLLKKYGYLEDRLCEMPMIVNPDIFKPRKLTPEQIEKYGCDIMFASNGSRPTGEIVRDIIVPEFASLKPEDRNQRTDVGGQRSEDRSESESCTSPAPQGDTAHCSLSTDSSPLQSSVCSLQSAVSSPPPLFPESLLLSIHDHLWEQYRAGRTFTSYEALKIELCAFSDHSPSPMEQRDLNPDSEGDRETASPLSSSPLCARALEAGTPGVRKYPSPLSGLRSHPSSFAGVYNALSPDDRDFVTQTLFWRLNDVIYRHAVLEWLDEIVTSEEDCRQQTTDNRPKSESCTSPAPQGDNPTFVSFAPFVVKNAHSQSSVSQPSPCASPAPQGDTPHSALSPLPSSPSQSIVYGLSSMVCDRPAIAPPRIRLHLYGKGWEHHPRFAKYAKGPIAHGQELSIAYQAAKLCLHLNANEGLHQRLHEILCSRGCLLTRSHTTANPPCEPPAELMRRLTSDVTHTDLSVKEEEALSRWINSIASKITPETMDPDSALSAPLIEAAIHEIIQQSFARPDWIIAGWEQNSFTDQSDLTHKLMDALQFEHHNASIYSESPDQKADLITEALNI